MAVRDIERDARVHAVLRIDVGAPTGSDSGSETQGTAQGMTTENEPEDALPALRQGDILQQQVRRMLRVPAPEPT